jgi:formylglycine-generating enzyme
LDLLQEGSVFYKASYYKSARESWQRALTCPNLTDSERQILNDSLTKVQQLIASSGKSKSPKKPSLSPPFKMQYMPDMVLVVGGTFKMGNDGDAPAEKPSHYVTVNSFYMSKYEITVAQFDTFVKEMGYITTAETAHWSNVFSNGNWQTKQGAFWKHSVNGYLRSYLEYNHPAIHVSWEDAKAYCDWVSVKLDRKYRLPTEAEWEYAARGGNRSNGYIYSGSNTIGDVAWYGDNSTSTTHNVCGKTANELGLFDMSGNVWEWCNDWYGADYYTKYPNSSADNPTGPDSGTYRVIRGGPWYGSEAGCRVTYRTYNAPNMSYDAVGFRVVFSN